MSPDNAFRHLGLLGAAALGAVIGALSSPTGRIWTEHWDYIVLVIANVALFAIFVTYMITRGQIQATIIAEVERLRHDAREDEERLNILRGRVYERGLKINELIERGNRLADRTIQLRDADLLLAGSLVPIEDKLRLARTQAIEKLKMTFDEAAWQDDGDIKRLQHEDPPASAA